MSGKLILIIGCMWSGKTTKLLQYYNIFKLKFPCILINHKNDDRYKKNNICTHDMKIENCVSLKNIDELDKEVYKKNRVILIDEGQFFDKNIIKFTKKAINIDNKIVIIAGLNGDFKKNKMGYILDLIMEADKIDHCSAVCHYCKDFKYEASFSMRKNKNDNKQLLIGSSDKYVSVCRYHYNKFNNYIE